MPRSELPLVWSVCVERRVIQIDRQFGILERGGLTTLFLFGGCRLQEEERKQRQTALQDTARCAFARVE